ncbi:C40 family peptidase [Psychrobacillus sp. Sa2BUA9]|uniref:C40 family peptidase n=1 Tax=Psychrobacillus faecigallinarum TaxID=2762235 RepID=A0ABR8R5U5_9BACI|nr:C40 family peptidase [Psychrobacillus faecigallinarum]MBD7943120.1 C40 family peptidase [Psychrobacillus faecigallinarum]
MFKKIITIFTLTLVLAMGTFAGNTEAASTVASNKIVSSANNLIGIKYRYGGTTKAGFDCSGFIGYVYKSNGITLPRTAAGMYSKGTSVKKANLAVGDLVFFNTSGKGVSHVGMFIGNGKFIHASTSKGVRVDKINDPYYWGKKYVGAKKVANVQVAKK